MFVLRVSLLVLFALYTLYLLFITEVHLIWHSEIVVFKMFFFYFYFCLYARKENTSIKLFFFFECVCDLSVMFAAHFALFLHFKVIPYRRKEDHNLFLCRLRDFVVCGFVVVVVVVVACNWLFACFLRKIENRFWEPPFLVFGRERTIHYLIVV